MVFARQGERTLVNLVNTSGPHRTEPILETVAPVGPLNVSLKTDRAPSKLTLEPSGKSLPFEYPEGRVETVVPAVAIHEAVVVQP